MSFSIQTNANSLIAQENLRVNSNFQSQTIRRLTSGYRINQSGDDAKYLACRKAHFRRSGKPAAPEAKPRYKMADPFWDRA